MNRLRLRYMAQAAAVPAGRGPGQGRVPSQVCGPEPAAVTWVEFQRQFDEASRAYDGRIAPSLEIREVGDCAQVYAVVTYDDGAVERSPITAQRLKRLRELAAAEGLDCQADPYTCR